MQQILGDTVYIKASYTPMPLIFSHSNGNTGVPCLNCLNISNGIPGGFLASGHLPTCSPRGLELIVVMPLSQQLLPARCLLHSLLENSPSIFGVSYTIKLMLFSILLFFPFGEWGLLTLGHCQHLRTVES